MKHPDFATLHRTAVKKLQPQSHAGVPSGNAEPEVTMRAGESEVIGELQDNG
jgi:hypothetical protein